MEKKMFYGASNLIFERAKQLRNNQTHAEVILWEYLRHKPSGYKFRRQHPLGIFIADFYCHSLKLVIEIDGSIHENEEVKNRDIERQKIIEADGITVLRFSNHQIEKELEIVISIIENIINQQIKKPL